MEEQERQCHYTINSRTMGLTGPIADHSGQDRRRGSQIPPTRYVSNNILLPRTVRPSLAARPWAEVRAGRTSPRSSRPPTTSADAKCTCGEAVRFPDERSEELCEAKSQEGARSPTRSSRSSRRES